MGAAVSGSVGPLRLRFGAAEGVRKDRPEQKDRSERSSIPPGFQRPARGWLPIHPLAWLAWLAAAATALSLARNPLYLGAVLLCIALVAQALRPQAKAPPLPFSPLRFGLLIVVASALFNALTSHFGATVLFRLPGWLPLIGGPITLEGLVFGALNGLALAGFLAAFTVLNQALPTHTLIRLIPRAFYPVAVVVSIAVAFVPTTLAQFQQIREAQMVRGHQVRGLRDWLPLFMPLFVGGLERAMQLAEAMTARGFASAGDSHPVFGTPESAAGRSLPEWLNRLGVVVGMIAVLAGLLLRLVWGSREAGLGLILAGSLLLLAALWSMGRSVRRSTYRPQPWRRPDWLVLAGAGLLLAAYLLPLPWIDRTVLAYSPYPRLSLPAVDRPLMLATAGLLGPVWMLVRQPAVA